jgi:hypothetical protein
LDPTTLKKVCQVYDPPPLSGKYLLMTFGWKKISKKEKKRSDQEVNRRKGKMT